MKHHEATGEPVLTATERAAVWDAINEYAAACGGDTSNTTISPRRMDAVAEVDRRIEAAMADCPIPDCGLPLYEAAREFLQAEVMRSVPLLKAARKKLAAAVAECDPGREAAWEEFKACAKTPSEKPPQTSDRVEVYSRPECVFNYCPTPVTCRHHDECCAPARTPEPEGRATDAN